MANQAKNDAQLEALFMPLLRNAADYIVQKIWNENRELIRKIVYDAYHPEQYQRTGEFKEAWDTSVKTLRNTVEGRFNYDPRLLTVDGEHHGSIINGQPMTTYLAEVIYEGLAGDIYHGGYARDNPAFSGEAWARKRDVWAALNKWFTKTKLRELFEESMRAQGVNVQRHNVAITRMEYYG